MFLCRLLVERLTVDTKIRGFVSIVNSPRKKPRYSKLSTVIMYDNFCLVSIPAWSMLRYLQKAKRRCALSSARRLIEPGGPKS